jgi:hypothetical protein
MEAALGSSWSIEQWCNSRMSIFRMYLKNLLLNGGSNSTRINNIVMESYFLADEAME